MWKGDHLIAESAEHLYRAYVYKPGTFRRLEILDGEGPAKVMQL
ncbi:MULTISPECIES: hypothetical protein [Pseudomonas]|nr:MULTISPECIES: hypothetical protein [Pseudomonas]